MRLSISSIKLRAPQPFASLVSRRTPLLTQISSRNLLKSSKLSTKQTGPQLRLLSTSPALKMSFSNTDTGDKPADPYKEKNVSEPALKEKIQDLVSFIEACKFGMMTTRVASSGLIVSRCMALAGKVKLSFSIQVPSTLAPLSLINLLNHLSAPIGRWRHRPPLSHQHRIWQNRRPKIRPQNQHRLPQLHRRMGLHLGRSHHRHRQDHGPQILLPGAQSLARRSGGRETRRWARGSKDRGNQGRGEDGDLRACSEYDVGTGSADRQGGDYRRGSQGQ